MSIDLGNKRVCVGCGAKFYDLGKNPAKCPKCATINDSTIAHRKRGRAKAVVTGDADDPLLKEKAKMELRQAKAKKPVKEIEGVDLDAFEDIEPIAGDDDIEEIEEDEMETLESLEELDEGGDDDEEEEIEGEVLIDSIDEDEEEEDEDEDEDERPAKKSSAKTAKKAPAKKAPAKKPTKKR
ncbi:MAG: FYDLN acid domain-containing protein [Alphaproteobacteria bacterium]|nr:FYDLN acid domain-containing protein [Alphaproteobacteria bacterium]